MAAATGLRAVRTAAAAGSLAPVRRALISVSDKTGIEPLGACLHELGVDILSTGGTAAKLRAASFESPDVKQ